jgi:hypothetical protein
MRYVRNQTLVNVDFEGWQGQGWSISPGGTLEIPPINGMHPWPETDNSSSPCSDFDRRKKDFLDWYNKEKADGAWWVKSQLPACPCKIQKRPSTSGTWEWFSVSNSGYERLTGNQINNQWYAPGKPIGNYHKGADICMRSKPINGSASQCCYVLGLNGYEVITEGSGSGSVDRVDSGNWPFSLWGNSHNSSDMVPANNAEALDGGCFGKYSKMYLEVRPSLSGNCPKKEITPENFDCKDKKNCCDTD